MRSRNHLAYQIEQKYDRLKWAVRRRLGVLARSRSYHMLAMVTHHVCILLGVS